MIELHRLEPSTIDSNLERINELITQQSPGEREVLTRADIYHTLLENGNFHIILVIDTEAEAGRRCVGMASIFFQRNLTRWIAEIHDVVVDESYRGRGLGETLVKNLIERVQEFAFQKREKIKLYLTSRPSRVAANALYIKLGFVLVAKAEGEWGTNLYKMMVKPE